MQLKKNFHIIQLELFFEILFRSVQFKKLISNYKICKSF